MGLRQDTVDHPTAADHPTAGLPGGVLTHHRGIDRLRQFRRYRRTRRYRTSQKTTSCRRVSPPHRRAAGLRSRFGITAKRSLRQLIRARSSGASHSTASGYR
jgi:hypothetical protein